MVSIGHFIQYCNQMYTNAAFIKMTFSTLWVNYSRFVETELLLLHYVPTAQVSLYVKGFGAAAVHDKIRLQRRTLLII
jgi:hypothetical protein